MPGRSSCKRLRPSSARSDDGMRLVRLTQQGRSIEAAARVVLVAAGLGNRARADGPAARTRIRAGSRIGAGCLVADAPDFYDERTIFMAVGQEGYVGTGAGGGRQLERRRRVRAGAWFDAAARRASPRRRSSRRPGSRRSLASSGAHWQGTAGLTRQTRPLAADRLFLLGDAAGYVEPFTGEGIAWALASAQAVAPLALRAMERWDPRIGRAWSDLHRRLIGRRQLVCRAVAMALQQPWLASIGFEVLTRVPAAAASVIRRLNAPPSLTNAS